MAKIIKKAKPKVLILRTAGTNCDYETDFAFHKHGAITEKIHINRIIEDPKILKNYQILAFPGGFSYGDYISAGKITAGLIHAHFQEQVHRFVKEKKLIMGICNGFQILVKTGLLPGLDNNYSDQTATLMNNDSGTFICKWTKLKINNNTIFTKGLPAEIELPIAHAEGKFYASKKLLDRLETNGQVFATYSDNPNGSLRAIAGITDPTGHVMGMMPHPERNCLPEQNPRKHDPAIFPAGDIIFKNAVEYFL